MYKNLQKKILNIPFSNKNMQKTIDICLEQIKKKSRNCKQIVVANVFSTVIASKDKKFIEICNKSFLVFPDGQPIIWISKLFNNSFSERVAGPDFMKKFLKYLESHGKSIFLLGGDKKSISDLVINLQNLYPSLKIVGFYSPPFGFWNKKENSKIINLINKSKADMLFVGVSTPKQDKWIFNNKKYLKIKLAIGVGAAFDFFSGKTNRAPIWMQKIGLEWFYRFIQEPKRMWKRYLIGNLIFIWLVLKEIIKRKILGEYK